MESQAGLQGEAEGEMVTERQFGSSASPVLVAGTQKKCGRTIHTDFLKLCKKLCQAASL